MAEHVTRADQLSETIRRFLKRVITGYYVYKKMKVDENVMFWIDHAPTALLTGQALVLMESVDNGDITALADSEIADILLKTVLSQGDISDETKAEAQLYFNHITSDPDCVDYYQLLCKYVRTIALILS